eukprot:COSAG03_NODE_2139_length_3085_cov_4.380107_2_plen_162_part_00
MHLIQASIWIRVPKQPDVEAVEGVPAHNVCNDPKEAVGAEVSRAGYVVSARMAAETAAANADANGRKWRFLRRDIEPKLLLPRLLLRGVCVGGGGGSSCPDARLLRRDHRVLRANLATPATDCHLVKELSRLSTSVASGAGCALALLVPEEPRFRETLASS